MADITDVYAWMSTDGSKVNLIMNVSPGDPGTRHFDNTVQYVWHVNSVDQFGSTTPTETKVICTFASDTSIQCWVGADKDYVKGDPSNTAGLTSADGKLKVFAGRRSDPFFFNLNGFKDAVATVEAAVAGGQITSATVDGCPHITPPVATLLRGKLDEQAVGSAATHPPCSGSDVDCFKRFDVMSIVVQVDKSLLNSGANTLVRVWGSTHAAQ
ncbi:MAG: DUF4331 family protein [Deltaproteobacteria bacterium]|nr:DUF4331 family protein [Deltaproteobacteria bacterium]